MFPVPKTREEIEQIAKEHGLQLSETILQSGWTRRYALDFTIDERGLSEIELAARLAKIYAALRGQSEVSESPATKLPAGWMDNPSQWLTDEEISPQFAV